LWKGKRMKKVEGREKERKIKKDKKERKEKLGKKKRIIFFHKLCF
jgi:hypothetical protein